MRSLDNYMFHYRKFVDKCQRDFRFMLSEMYKK